MTDKVEEEITKLIQWSRNVIQTDRDNGPLTVKIMHIYLNISSPLLPNFILTWSMASHYTAFVARGVGTINANQSEYWHHLSCIESGWDTS